ncbi:MAG: NAD(P)-dependent alcohol dehydrogenase [Gammaproteobacteria bacterium]|nr:NAD(P)-dependent alcohol dehydrogenase [Gammaproteobacteria bacterium]
MKAVRLTAFDGPRGLQLLDLPEPRPGENEVLVRIRAASLNYRDLVIARGSYAQMQLPIIPLSDASGEVVEVGSAVKRFAVGDRVCPHYIMDWVSGPPAADTARRRLGGPTDGVLAEYVCLPQHALVRAPANLSHVQSATLPIAALTAWQALFVRASLTPGQTLLTQGTGGVSLFALQLARAAGVRVIVTSSSAEKLERARALGASAGINYAESPDWPGQVLALTDGQGADHVIEVVGGNNLKRSIAATRMGGTISIIGFLESAEGAIDLRDAFRLVVNVHAISVGARDGFEALVRAVEQNHIEPVVDRVFGMDDCRAAYEQLASGRHFGKVVIEL